MPIRQPIAAVCPKAAPVARAFVREFAGMSKNVIQKALAFRAKQSGTVIASRD
jgi:hypothetical protein